MSHIQTFYFSVLQVKGHYCLTYSLSFLFYFFLFIIIFQQSAELLLAIIESSQDVVHILLPPLMKLGLASLLINLLDIEVSKLMCERAPERCVDTAIWLKCLKYFLHLSFVF